MAISSQILKPTSSTAPSSSESAPFDWTQHLAPRSGEADYYAVLVALVCRELAVCWAPCLSTLSTLPLWIWVFSPLYLWKSWDCETVTAWLGSSSRDSFRPVAASTTWLFTRCTVSGIIQRMRDGRQGCSRANIPLVHTNVAAMIF